MANTYSQLYAHIVFSVKNRQSLLQKEVKSEVYNYIAGVIANQGYTLIAINGMADHIHILIGYKPTLAISSLIREIKEHSTKWINSQQKVMGKFEWQKGFGVFSVSRSGIDQVADYIRNQENHHAKRNFHQEYVGLLTRHGVDFDLAYTFDLTPE